MPYCSYCAGVMEPGQTQCPRCGRGTSAPIAVAPTGRPSSVTIAAALLVVAFLLSILALASFLFTPNAVSRLSPLYWFRTFGFWIAWIVLIALFWQRQSWTRIAIAALIAWNIGNLALGLSRVSPFALMMPILIAIIRVAAVFVMFKSDSNKWFKK